MKLVLKKIVSFIKNTILVIGGFGIVFLILGGIIDLFYGDYIEKTISICIVLSIAIIIKEKMEK